MNLREAEQEEREAFTKASNNEWDLFVFGFDNTKDQYLYCRALTAQARLWQLELSMPKENIMSDTLDNTYSGLLHSRTEVGAELREMANIETRQKFPFCRIAPIMPIGSNGIPFMESYPVQPGFVAPDLEMMMSFTNLPEDPDLPTLNEALEAARLATYSAWTEWYKHLDSAEYTEWCNGLDSMFGLDEDSGFSLTNEITCERLYKVEAGWNSRGATHVADMEELFWLACWERQHEPNVFNYREIYLKAMVDRNVRLQRIDTRAVKKDVEGLTDALAQFEVDADAKVTRLVASITDMSLQS